MWKTADMIVTIGGLESEPAPASMIWWTPDETYRGSVPNFVDVER